MKILILGGDGMLGHQLLIYLEKKHDVRVTLRQDSPTYKKYSLFNDRNSYFNVDVRQIDQLVNAISDFKPQAIVNAIGLVKQRESAKDPIPSIEINSLFPHRLALICKQMNIRLIHLSTDCIFSGKKGRYTENDLSDAEDLYGKSKYLGEVKDDHCVTIRSSIIGLELSHKAGLIEWFLAQSNPVKGFCKAIYTGLTTQEMSRVIESILLNHTNLSGIWHIASNSINKYDLLILFSHLLKKNIRIEPENKFICDRSLIGQAFSDKTGYQAPSWTQMLSELAFDVIQRDKINNKRGFECNA